ncbi:unnamed protein product [Pylaiella littoralis]
MHGNNHEEPKNQINPLLQNPKIKTSLKIQIHKSIKFKTNLSHVRFCLDIKPSAFVRCPRHCFFAPPRVTLAKPLFRGLRSPLLRPPFAFRSSGWPRLELGEILVRLRAG